MKIEHKCGDGGTGDIEPSKKIHEAFEKYKSMVYDGLPMPKEQDFQITQAFWAGALTLCGELELNAQSTTLTREQQENNVRALREEVKTKVLSLQAETKIKLQQQRDQQRNN